MTTLKMMTLAAAAVALVAPPPTNAATVTTIATFNPAQFEFPENIAIDRDNNLYVSLLLANQVRKITPAGVQSTYATFSGVFGSLTAGLVINDETGDLYVAYDAAGQNSAVYVVHPDQSKQIIATFPAGAGLNGMTPDGAGNLYLADAFLGVVWRVPASGGAPVVWLDLHAPGNLMAPGPNGIKFDMLKRNLYVSVSFQGTIYRIPVDTAGNPGTPVPFATGLPPDDFTFDRTGNLYVATEPAMSVVRISPDGTQTTVASAADGLQRTTAVLFGRVGEANLDLYVLSFGLPGDPLPSNPGVFQIEVGLPGLPVSIP